MASNKNWMVLFVFAGMIVLSGCPDDDTCPSGDECLCYGICPDGGDADAEGTDDNGADADSDADPDTEDSGADADGDAGNITGDWYFTYRDEMGRPEYWNVHFDQTGIDIIGWDWDAGGCDYTGSISTEGHVSLYRDCTVHDTTLTGNLVNPDRMTGNYYSDDGDGTWTADRE